MMLRASVKQEVVFEKLNSMHYVPLEIMHAFVQNQPLSPSMCELGYICHCSAVDHS